MSTGIPEWVSARGNVKAVYVDGGCADPSAPTTTELSSGVDLSCFLMPDWGGVTAEQNKGGIGRFCSKQIFETLGNVTVSLGTLQYTYLPQQIGASPADAANDVYVGLTSGNTGDVVIGYGIDGTATFASEDVADVVPVECGYQNKSISGGGGGGDGGGGEFAPLTIMQELAVTGDITEDAIVAAGV